MRSATAFLLAFLAIFAVVVVAPLLQAPHPAALAAPVPAGSSSREATDDNNRPKVSPILVKHIDGKPHVALVHPQDPASGKGANLIRGKHKIGEPTIEADYREAKEEAGYSKSDLQRVGRKIKGTDNGKKVVAQVFHVKPGAQQGDRENRKLEWAPLAEAKDKVAGHKGVGKILDNAKGAINAPQGAGKKKGGKK